MSRVERNGVVAYKPHWMSQEYWEKYEAPRIGKKYGEGLYGEGYKEPSYKVEEEDDDGCGGACKI